MVAVRQRLRLLLPPPQPVRAFRTVPGLRWTGRASGTLGSRPASAPRGANCLRGCCMTRRAGTRRKRATTTSTLNTGGRRALSDRAACGGSVDRFLHVWASFRIHTGNWDVRLMYLWGEQSQGTPQLASTVVMLHVLASALVTYFTAINCDFKQHFRTGLHVTVPVSPKGCYGTVTWST